MRGGVTQGDEWKVLAYVLWDRTVTYFLRDSYEESLMKFQEH